MEDGLVGPQSAVGEGGVGFCGPEGDGVVRRVCGRYCSGG